MRTLYMTGYADGDSQLPGAVKDGATVLREPLTPKELLRADLAHAGLKGAPVDAGASLASH